MAGAKHLLTIEPLSAAAFHPFGDVIEVSDAARHFSINDGYARRYHDLANVEVVGVGARAMISIFRAKPRVLPMRVHVLERHPLGSQAFMPLSALPYLVVVAEAGPEPVMANIRCFRAASGQGVNYARGTWHHPLIALERTCVFLVIDRGGPASEANCDEFPLAAIDLHIA